MALVNCPECGKEVSSTAESCPNCGYGVREHFSNSCTTSQQHDEKKNICPYCKTENHADASVCKACHKNISTAGVVGDTLKATGDVIEGMGCLICGAISAVVFIIILISCK